MSGLSLRKISTRIYVAARWRLRSLYWRARQRAKQSLPAPVLRILAPLKKAASHLVTQQYSAVLHAYNTKGCVVACELIESLSNDSLKAKCYRMLAREALPHSVQDAAHLARQALLLDSSAANQLRNCVTLWDAGGIQEAHELLTGVSKETLSPAERLKALQIEGAYRLYRQLPDIPGPAASAVYTCDPACILYVASSSRPYHTTGYTTRTHHLLQALKEQGWAVHCVTRPGYPYDRPDSKGLDSPVLNVIDGVPYERIDGNHRREIRYDRYLIDAADKLEQAARRLRPAVIHAASNYEAALPALIAARRLGIPFCYEVRGLWEYTAASKKMGWEHTERFELDRRLEAHTALHADQVFTLTKALAAELVRRGAAEDRIALLPNAVNLSFFQQVARDEVLATELGLGANTFVCGYIGSVVKYEGLDDLVAAMPALIKQVPNSKLLIIGDGEELSHLREHAKLLGVAGAIIFTGKVPHAEVARYFSLMTTIALPRKPYTVCQLVSPLKPFEAMAMRVPLVVSDVDALAEIFIQGETALLHKAGDSESLADALIKLAESPDLRRYLVSNAFAHVSRISQWSQVIQPLCNFYSRTGVITKFEDNKSTPIRVLSVGSLPPEWGGESEGGVASIHQVVLKQWFAEKPEAINVVGVIANNWSGTRGPDLPSMIPIFEPPTVQAEEREWYCSLLQRERIDCVLFFHVAHRWAYWHAQFCKAVPAVGAVHSWHAVTMACAQDKAEQAKIKLQQSLPHFSSLIFPSKYCAQEGKLLGLNFSNDFAVVPNAISCEFIEAPLTEKKHPQRIVFVGSLIERKRADLLIRAAALLDLELTIIGEGVQRNALEQLANALMPIGQVTFLGSCTPDRIARELVQAGILCVPSTSESFGIVYLEALACGTPVVGFGPTLIEIESELGLPIGIGLAADAAVQDVATALQRVLACSHDPQQLREAVKFHYGAARAAAGYAQAVYRAVRHQRSN